MAKGITWRVLGAADTFVLSFLVTGKATAACGIVGFELLTKSVLYYGHEPAWEMQVRWQWPAPMYRRLLNPFCRVPAGLPAFRPKREHQRDASAEIPAGLEPIKKRPGNQRSRSYVPAPPDAPTTPLAGSYPFGFRNFEFCRPPSGSPLPVAAG